MPQPSVLELVRVHNVTPCPTIHPGVIQFTILGWTIDTPSQPRQFQTIDSLKASLCHESKEPLWIKWRRDPKWGPTLIHVSPDRTKYQP